MNFVDVKSITIPEGDVTKITAGGVVIWEKVSALTYTDLVPTAIDKTTGSVLDGVGYRRGVHYSGSTMASNSACTCIGLIPIDGSAQHDIYLYGLNLTGTNKNAYVLWNASYSMMTATVSIKEGFSNTYIESITKLSDNYYKIRTKTYSTNVKYFAIGAVTVSGLTPVVTMDEPIF